MTQPPTKPFTPRPGDVPDTGEGLIAPADRELSGNLAGLSLPRQVVVLAIWPLLEQALNFLVTFIDTMITGHLPIERQSVPAMDAITVGGYVIWVVGMLQMSMGIGAAALVARAIGARHKRLANAALGQALVLGVCCGSMIAVGLWLIAPYLARLMNLDDQAAPFCVTYLRIIAPVAPMIGWLLIGNAALRAAGDTRRPFVVMVCVNLTNIATSLLFVYGPAPVGGHGVAGIAAGTALSWCVGSVIILTMLARGRSPIRLRLTRLRPHWHTMQRIIRVGVPNLVESSGMWATNFAVLWYIGQMHIRAAMGAHMIAVRLEGISYMLGFAIATAAATLVGQYMGLGDVQRARRAVLLCFGIALALMSAMGVLFLVVPEQLVHMVSRADEHRAMAPTLLRICAFIQPMFAAMAVFGAALRGAGDTRATMFLSGSSMIVLRLIVAYIVAVHLSMGLAALWVVLCADLALRGLLFGGRFLHGGWAKVRV